MPLNLPAPDKTQLARSPLALVVCQVRFEDILAVSEGKTVLALYDALGGRQGFYRKPERLYGQGLNIQLSPVGPATSTRPPEQGWRFTSHDGRWVVSLMPGYLTLETSAYSTWDQEFRPRLANLIEATAKHVEPDTEQRLGLRYLDRLVEPAVTSPQGWNGYITPELLGAILHERIGSGVTAAEQQIVLDVDDDTKCGLRHGFFADPARDQALTYVLDFDVYREGVRAFDPTDILATADQFNTVALQLFQEAVTPELRRLLKEPKDDRS